jgi:hypothetical protein
MIRFALKMKCYCSCCEENNKYKMICFTLNLILPNSQHYWVHSPTGKTQLNIKLTVHVTRYIVEFHSPTLQTLDWFQWVNLTTIQNNVSCECHFSKLHLKLNDTPSIHYSTLYYEMYAIFLNGKRLNNVHTILNIQWILIILNDWDDSYYWIIIFHLYSSTNNYKIVAHLHA